MPRIKELRFDNIARLGYEAWLRDDPHAIAVDTETTGFTWYDTAFCATVAWMGKDGVQSHYFELEQSKVDTRGMLAEMLGRTPVLVFHNAKFDLQKLIAAGTLTRSDLSSQRIEDTECLYHLLDPHGEKKLKPLARDILGETTNEAEAIRKACSKLKIRKRDPDFGYHLLPRTVVYPYALKDAEFTIRLWQALAPRVGAFDDLTKLYQTEMELTLVLLDVEAKGMRVDLAYVDEAIKQTNGEILKCEFVIEDITGKKVWYPEKQGQKTPEGRFNPNSHQQIAAEFERSGVVVENTKEETLARMDHPLAESILELRGKKKLLNTYLMNIKHETRDGIIHPAFRQHGAKTGRMSSAGEKGD